MFGRLNELENETKKSMKRAVSRLEIQAETKKKNDSGSHKNMKKHNKEKTMGRNKARRQGSLGEPMAEKDQKGKR